MGNNINLSMKVAIICLLVAYVATQAPQKWICCEQNSMWVPTWGTKCGSRRRLQAIVEKACPIQLSDKKNRMLQAAHPTIPACTNFSAKRRLQKAVPKTPAKN